MSLGKTARRNGVQKRADVNIALGYHGLRADFQAIEPVDAGCSNIRGDLWLSSATFIVDGILPLIGWFTIQVDAHEQGAPDAPCKGISRERLMTRTW